MRLIDADKLKFCKIVQPYKGEVIDQAFVDILDIDKIPTAYDVDKVVKQLKELKTMDVCDFYDCPDDDISCEECIRTRLVNKVIEIVKAGGINE